MKKHTRLRSAYGQASITLDNPQLVRISADCHTGAYHAQGYASAQLRLWQLDLSRRVAAGSLSEVMGSATLKADRLQRNLGLRSLAQRCVENAAKDPERAYVQAYVDGINRAMQDMRLLPLEFYALGYKPKPFELLDVYLVAQLKYFINSAWQFELFHTLACQSLDATQSAQLFASFDEEGSFGAPICDDFRLGFAQDFKALLDDAKVALDQLGLNSPDIGSNAFAVRGQKTKSGFPLLANDPHMGLVNPGFNLFFHLQSGEGLNAIGSNFTGAPGIVIGRNPDIAWGMTGVMMDNQDLFYGKVDLSAGKVLTHQGWQDLQHTAEEIPTRKRAAEQHHCYRFSGGHMLMERQGVGLFLRWPALDQDLGSVSLHRLSCASNWDEFRQGLAELKNSPGIAVYADKHNNIGAQIYGLLPKRNPGRASAGALLLPLADARYDWQGYTAMHELPHEFNPEGQQVIHANQYAAGLFAKTYISNRWHSPARAMRIKELIAQKPALEAADMIAIQDDQLDLFARTWSPQLLQMLPQELRDQSVLRTWDGNTQNVPCALLFEKWFDLIVQALLTQHLPKEIASSYVNFWPAYRWNMAHILTTKEPSWGLDNPSELVRQAYIEARAGATARPMVEFRHSLRRHPALRSLFALAYPYAGGSRETISAMRRNIDFLTRGQSGDGVEGYSFGASFKMVFDLAPHAPNFYLANMPNSGNALGFMLRKHLRRWLRGERYRAHF